MGCKITVITEMNDRTVICGAEVRFDNLHRTTAHIVTVVDFRSGDPIQVTERERAELEASALSAWFATREVA